MVKDIERNGFLHNVFVILVDKTDKTVKVVLSWNITCEIFL